MADHETTFQEMKDRVRRFGEARDWGKYHNTKNLSMALSVEVAELMEIYQWLTTDESLTLHEDPEKRKAIEEEVADIATYLFEICNVLDIDLSEALKRKEKINAEKYPVK